MQEERIFVHATNVTGLGASQVATAILRALAASPRLPAPLDCYLPAVGPAAGFELASDRATLHRLRRRLPNSLSRLLECTLSHRYFPRYARGITLGDLPLSNVAHQVVLTHQSHLVSPAVNPHAATHLNARILRALFRRNLRYAHAFIVQTDVIRHQLERSYPELAGKVRVVPQPPPFTAAPAPHRPPPARPTLFYPAAGYPHKNHRLLARMAERPPAGQSGGTSPGTSPGQSGGTSPPCAEIVVTLRPDEAKVLGRGAPWLRNAGRLTPAECLATYATVDALFFPSLAESYGLPLVEAMTLDLPIVCADLPYARWLCEDQAIYFDPTDPAAAWQALTDLAQRLANGWRPDWSKPRAKLPATWAEVADAFLDLLGEDPPR